MGSSRPWPRGHILVSPLCSMVSFLTGILFQSWDPCRLLSLVSPGGQILFQEKWHLFPSNRSVTTVEFETCCSQPGVGRQFTESGGQSVNGMQSLGWWLPWEMTWRIPVMKFHAGVLKGLQVPIHSRVWAPSKLHQAWSRVFQSTLWHSFKQRRASPCLWLLFAHTRSQERGQTNLLCGCCHGIGFLTSQRSL